MPVPCGRPFHCVASTPFLAAAIALIAAGAAYAGPASPAAPPPGAPAVDSTGAAVDTTGFALAISLFRAVAHHDSAGVASSLSRGADVNRPEPATGATPVMIAAATGDTAAIRQLHAAGARLGLHAHNGMTALLAAAYKNQRAAAVMLLGSGSDLAEADTASVGPAGFARIGKSAACEELFGDLDRLYDLCARGVRDSVQMLVDKGVPVRVTNGGRSPIDVAKQNHHADVVKVLEVAARR